MADALDRVTGPGRPYPPFAWAVAVQHDVEREEPLGQVKLPDGVAPPDRAVSFGRHQQHHILAGQVAEPVELRGREPQPLHVRGEPDGVDDLEVQPGRAGRRPGQLRERIIQRRQRRSRQCVSHETASPFQVDTRETGRRREAPPPPRTPTSPAPPSTLPGPTCFPARAGRRTVRFLIPAFTKP